jgi:formylglycine-generating enzyme required for sulfatase activity
MGAPEDEPERFPNEGPRHKVRLNQGFWLADTACSQALWRAVMGNNPSRFQDDPQNSVESVSWDEAQVFLGRLQAWLPGVKLSLPSEAEWEYACRAGSDSPFNFGDTISPDLANYDGNYTYGDGREGEYRLKTVPVKSFAPNAWGLWQMHGNVWEWCAEGRRDYGRVRRWTSVARRAMPPASFAAVPGTTGPGGCAPLTASRGTAATGTAFWACAFP